MFPENMERVPREKYERPEGVLPPLKAIRAKCLDCMCDQRAEVKACPSEKCPLYVYRFGKRPKGGIYEGGQDEDGSNSELDNDSEDETDDG